MKETNTDNNNSTYNAKKYSLKKLNTFDWLSDLEEAKKTTNWVEVKFKNTRKDYYLNSNKIAIKKGDIVAVEATSGHDIGTVTLTGALVLKQMAKTKYRHDQEPKRIYRVARENDLEKYKEAKAREHETMLLSRQIAKDLNLNMKIGDVEYQGDGNKAIFYYIADERVDFRQLIKVLAEKFHVKIEMKQIGSRQEAGRIGGVGPCGRELCCSSWITNFVSVSTNVARYQDLSLNPQKLAGQCAKLKCCLNYELDIYAEAKRDFPPRNIPLQTQDAEYFFFKNDILTRQITYSTSKDILANAITIPAERAKKIIQLNNKGIKVENISENPEIKSKIKFGDLLNEEITRFDSEKKNKRNSRNKKGNNRNRKQSPNTDRKKPVNTKDSSGKNEIKKDAKPQRPRNKYKKSNNYRQEEKKNDD